MMTLTEKAWAKLNLTLDILGKREDGYHDLKSVMQTISLYDMIEMDIGTGEPWKLSCSREDIPCDERNLAWKAARLYCDTVGFEPDGIAIRMVKNIPSGAGMGGGSADAAAVLRILNRHCGDKLSPEELADLGARVGSDVPFCVIGGTVMCEGRGEIMRRLPDMPKCVIVGCKPEFSVSTPVLFRKIDSVEIYDHPDNDAMEQAIISGDAGAIAKEIYNVFDPVVSEDHPEIEHIKGICRCHGALAVQMTGSGSVVFAVMPDQKSAEAARMELEKTYPQAFVAEPV
jgi:4-diphosphocytidyl-2-C-methyl-D-erythritol kinase